MNVVVDVQTRTNQVVSCPSGTRLLAAGAYWRADAHTDPDASASDEFTLAMYWANLDAGSIRAWQVYAYQAGIGISRVLTLVVHCCPTS